MLAKLRSWPHRTLIKTPNSSPFSCFSRFLSHSFSNDPYDPPFAVTSKPTKSKHKPKRTPTKSTEPIVESNDLKLPLKSDLPFEFRYSYSESNQAVEPIGYREPKRFSPFGPGRLDRKWTGTAAPVQSEVDMEMVIEERNRVLGEPLTEEEVDELVERYRHSDCSRQINIGKF